MPKKYFHFENTMLNKADILERIKAVSQSKTDADLARFLGVNPATLSNWKTRGSIDYDLVFSKCEHINLDWLLTGRGNPKPSDSKAPIAAMLSPEKEEVYKDTIKEQQKTIIELSQEVGELKERIRQTRGVEKEAGADTYGVFGSTASSFDPVGSEQSGLSDVPAPQKTPRSTLERDIK